MSPYTLDTLFDQRLRIRQPREGYRFSVDPVLLAHHAGPLTREHILDLGTGCGIIPLILGYRYPETRIVGVEIQEELADMARNNVSANKMAAGISIIRGDVRKLAPEGKFGAFDMVLSNPPYRQVTAGRINPHSQRAVARHEISLTLGELLTTAGKMLRPGGTFLTIYPAERTVDLLTLMRKKGMEPKSLRTVHPRSPAPGKLVIVQGVKGGNPGLALLPPLLLHGKENSYTEEVERMFLP